MLITESTSKPAPGDVLSPSQLNGFLNCSAKWFFKHVEKLPDPASGSLVRGRAVHKVVNYWFQYRMELGTTPEPGEMAEAYDNAWEQASEGAAFGATEDIAELKASGEQLAAKYLAEAAPEIDPAALDVPVTGEIGGVKVRGYIDLLDLGGRIVDLKTASRKPSGVSPDYALQVATYAQIGPGFATGEVRLDTIVATKQTQLVSIGYTVSDDDRRMTERLYPHVQRLMKAGAVCPNRSSNLCSRKYCAFADRCISEFGGHVE